MRHAVKSLKKVAISLAGAGALCAALSQPVAAAGAGNTAEVRPSAATLPAEDAILTLGLQPTAATLAGDENSYTLEILPNPVTVAAEEPRRPAQTQISAVVVAQAASPDVNDPLEGLNRVIFEVNEFLYALLLRPLAEFYVLLIPDDARDGIRNILVNLRTPIILANDLLQGEGERAWITTERFFINTTLGLGGLIDVAEMHGIKGHKEDLGQTFAVWGVPEGFYLVLPILGPSNPRDAIGKFLDSYLDPLSYYLDNTDRQEYDLARQAMLGVDEFSRVKDELQKLKETSVDYYAALRSISRQKRNADIRNGAPQEGVPLPDLNYDFNAELNVP